MTTNPDHKSADRKSDSGTTSMRRAIMVRLKAKPMLIAIAALVIVMGFGTGVIVVYAMDAGKSVSATIEKLSRGAASMLGLTVTEVLVTGRIETPRSKLLAALGVKRGDLILGFDPHQARLRLLKIGWVAQADVQRRLPNTIFVRITEQKPAAIWQHNGRFKLIGRDGAIVSDRVSRRYKDLKILVGEDAPSHVANLIKMLESEPDLMAFVTHATRVGSRRWNLLLTQGIDIRLPAKAPNKAWKHLAALQRKHQLLQKRIRMVDLRVPDRMTVQLLKDSSNTLPGEET